MTLFSIIIPTYNQGNLLSDCLNSLICQTYKKWEAIIIDNFSNDNTQTIIKSFCDKRINSYQINNDGIIAVSRNFGIDKSKGEYICFLDSDDYWFDNKLEVISKLINNGYNFISNGEVWIKDGKRKCLKKYKNHDHNLHKRLLFLGNNLSTSGITVERKLLLRNKGFCTNKNFRGIEDYELWLRLANDESRKYFSISEPLGIFRIHNRGNSRNLKRQLSSEINVLKYHLRINKKNLSLLNLSYLFIRIMKLFINYILKGNLKIFKERLLSFLRLTSLK